MTRDIWLPYIKTWTCSCRHVGEDAPQNLAALKMELKHEKVYMARILR